MLMLCEVGSGKDLDKKWIAERKIDGVRCLAIVQGGNVRLIGRNGTDYTNKFEEIVEELSHTEMLEGLFDGEIVCDTFNHTASRVHNQNRLKAKLLKQQYPATFWVFDKISEKKLIDRKKDIQGWNGKFIKSVEFSYDLKALWEQANRENWEGIIIKNPESFYQKRRSYDWLKIKRNKFKDIEFNSYSINPAGIRLENTEGIAIQVTGSQHRAVKEQLDKLGKCICEVKYLEELESGKLRMPTFSKLKDGN